jgi:hypothetical protein
MEAITLGRFGDRRLEKGGHFCTSVWSKPVAVVFAFVALAATGLARSGCFAFCTMQP